MKVFQQFHIRPMPRCKRWRHVKWWVVVLRTVTDVRKMYGTGAANCVAWTRKRQDGKQCPRTGELGVIVLPKRAGNQVVVHEAVHAALATLAFIKTGKTWPIRCLSNEEAICKMVGDIAGQLTAKLYRYGVWKRERK